MTKPVIMLFTSVIPYIYIYIYVILLMPLCVHPAFRYLFGLDVHTEIGNSALLRNVD
jgi:hypothetical protein